jgi:hypothetical protein
MRHPRADVAVTAGPTVIAPGMAVLPLPRMLFWVGSISEQVLVVNVRGSGLVLISGCGHPPIERILGIAERVLDVPIGAVGRRDAPAGACRRHRPDAPGGARQPGPAVAADQRARC